MTRIGRMTEVQPTPLVKAGHEAADALLQSALALCREKRQAEFSSADGAARTALPERELIYTEKGDFAADLLVGAAVLSPSASDGSAA
jgi:hypothetical protein